MIANRYQIETEIGQGGMGTVYKGLDTHTRQIIAIKHLRPELTAPELIERFKREGEALRELNHPNIVKMLDTVEEDNSHYLIIEYLAGGDLADLLKQGKLPIEKVLHIAIDICDALTRAHRLNIIHRDLKPANVLIAADGTPRLTDFGIAHFAGKARVTASDSIVGTVEYLAPEILDGELADPRADIWAFGVMLFEMLAGKRPFTGQSIAQTLMAIVTQPTPDLETLSPDAPVALVDLVYRMLEKDRHARIASVRHVGAELEDILQGRSADKVIIVQETRFATPTPDILQRAKHNLPAQTTPFVGREAELAELAKLLNDPKIRLVTIVAQGGMGKTRLALEAAERQKDRLKDGVYFVELAPLSDTYSIIPAIAEATGYQFQTDERQPKHQLLDFLSNKNLLLVMDNYEHLLESAALVTDILKAASEVKILATSRQRLGQSGETVFNLEGMHFTSWATPEDALEYTAVKLFLQAAKRAKPDFEVTADNMDAIARICKLVEGLPLGILLAASWVSMLAPDEIAVEITKSLDFLESNLSDIPERQRSMRAVFDYSWDLMTEDERSVFMTLSLFRGGFTREAAEAVAGANLRILMNLMNKSLLRRNADSGRYEIHELLRQNGEDKLLASNELETTRDNHSIFFGRFIAQQLSLLKGGGQMAGINQIESEYDNCRAAWVWAVQLRNSEIVNQMLDSLYLYLSFRQWHDQGIVLFQLAREQWPALSTTAPLIAGRLAIRFFHTSDTAKRTTIIENSLANAQKEENLPEIAFCQRELGIQIGHRTSQAPETIQRGMRILETSLQNYRQLGDKFYIARVLDDIGWCHARLGDDQTRFALTKESLDMRQEIGDVIGFGQAAPGYIVLLRITDPEQSWQLLQDVYRTARQVNNRFNIAMATGMIGYWYLTKGDLEQSLQYQQDALELSIQANLETGIILGQLGMALRICIQGDDYDRVLQLLQSALPTPEKMVSNYTYLANGSIAYMMYYASIGEHTLLEKSLKMVQSTLKPTEGSLQAAIVNPLAIGIIPAVAMIRARKGHKERAAMLLGLTFEHLISQFLWLKHWKALAEFRASLETELGTDRFNSAYARGQSLNLETAFDEILAELGELKEE